MSIALSPLQQAVLREMGLTIYRERGVEGSASVSQAPASAQPLTIDAVLSDQHSMPSWLSKAQRFINADQISRLSLQALPPNAVKAKREVWQQLRVLMRQSQ
jgi:hypothetical protein